MDLPINDIVLAFKQEFKADECEELYQLAQQDILFTKEKLREFIHQGLSEDITHYELESLFEFIQTNTVMEVYINEIIAPFAPGMMIGKNIETEFVGSIGIYNRFASEKEQQVGAIMIAPIVVVCSLIQNAYLFVNDIENVTQAIERCKVLSEESMDSVQLYQHLIHLLIKPFYEVLDYRLLEPKKDIPQYIVTSFGLIEANYAIAHGKEIVKQIEKTLSDLLSSLEPQLKEESIIN